MGGSDAKRILALWLLIADLQNTQRRFGWQHCPLLAALSITVVLNAGQDAGQSTLEDTKLSGAADTTERRDAIKRDFERL